MSKIIKITFENGSEIEYKEKSLEDFKNPKRNNYTAGWLFRNQYKNFEEYEVLPKLIINLEDYAKESYDLIPRSDLKDIEDFSDWEIEEEFERRSLLPNLIKNGNIINQDFVSRIVEITERGNDSEIDKALEMLEKAYRIK